MKSITSYEEYKELVKADRQALGLERVNLFFEWLKGNKQKIVIYRFERCLRYYEYVIDKYKGKGVIGNIIYTIYKHRFETLKRKTNFFISPKVFGKGLHIVHYGYCWVDSSSVIGENCTILPRVLLGKKYQDAPIPSIYIGDNCYIGTGSTILGPVRIGNNVTIGAGSVVIHDIPDNCVVAGNPARIIKRKEIL
jgi:serine O-acetyltransferase